jgi:xylulokinase
VRPSITEAGALGAAIIAGVGSKVFPSHEAGVKAMVHLDKTFEPDRSKQALYEDRFEKYRQLWPLLKNYLRELVH